MYVIIVMGADRPKSGLRSKRTKCTKKFLILVMGAARPGVGLCLKKVNSGTARFWKRKFAELIGTQAQAQAHKKTKI